MAAVDEDTDEQPAEDEEYCTECGAIVKQAAVLCPECGVDREGGTGSAGGDDGIDDADVDVRDDWWHLIAFMPFAFFIGGTIGGAIAGLLMIPMLVLYPIAFYKDVSYAHQLDVDWEPKRSYWTVGGVIGSITMGIGSLLITPLYLWDRHKKLP